MQYKLWKSEFRGKPYNSKNSLPKFRARCRSGGKQRDRVGNRTRSYPTRRPLIPGEGFVPSL